MRFCFVFAILLLVAWTAECQNSKIEARWLTNNGYAYNFFTGSSTADMTTTIKALGSGFADFSGNYGYEFWIINPNKKSVGLASSININLSKYRFKENLIFKNQDNFLVVDENPNHYYNPDFFSRQGSKLVVWKLHLPLTVYLPVSKWFGDSKNFFGLGLQVFFDEYLFAYHKAIYNEGGALQKTKTQDYQIRNLFNKHFYGFRGQLKIWYVHIFGERTFVPLFKSPDYRVYENKIGIFISIKNLDSKLQDKFKDYITK